MDLQLEHKPRLTKNRNDSTSQPILSSSTSLGKAVMEGWPNPGQSRFAANCIARSFAQEGARDDRGLTNLYYSKARAH